MTAEEAIYARRSRRKYIESNLKEEDVILLQRAIDKYNRVGGFRIELVLNNGEAFKGFTRSYGMLSGVNHYFGLIASEDDPHANEKLGYYGELLVLQATILGLGTCWVGGTFSKSKTPFQLESGEHLACLITVGEVKEELSSKEQFIHKMSHLRKSKEAYELYRSGIELPYWLVMGMEAVAKAPSAMNKQPVRFYHEKEGIYARVKRETKHLVAFDLGIAKLHFEIGAGENGCPEGAWEWGNGGKFTWHKNMLSAVTNQFDLQANIYDNEHRKRRAYFVAEKIIKLTAVKRKGQFMEYGCGTGLVSLFMAWWAHHITLLDSSEKMLEVLAEKIATSKVENLTLKQVDLTKEKISETFDVIYSSMVLHHIKETKEIIQTFYDLLNEDGRLCIVDLNKEDGSFHQHVENYDGHNGFDQSYLMDVFEECGFVDVQAETFYENDKDHSYEGTAIPYSLFVISGRKENKSENDEVLTT